MTGARDAAFVDERHGTDSTVSTATDAQVVIGDVITSCGQYVGHCSPITHEPCPPGQGCYPVTTNDFYCLPSGSGGRDEACTRNSDCQRGFACPPAFHRCVKMCCALGGGDDCANPESGGQSGDGCVRPWVAGLLLCSPLDCDAVAQVDNGCPAFAPYCRLPGIVPRCGSITNDSPLPSGSRCTRDNDCSPGFGCLSVRWDGGAASAVCTRYCRLDGTATCPSPQICTPLSGHDVGIGGCVTP